MRSLRDILTIPRHNVRTGSEKDTGTLDLLNTVVEKFVNQTPDEVRKNDGYSKDGRPIVTKFNDPDVLGKNEGRMNDFSKAIGFVDQLRRKKEFFPLLNALSVQQISSAEDKNRLWFGFAQLDREQQLAIVGCESELKSIFKPLTDQHSRQENTRIRDRRSILARARHSLMNIAHRKKANLSDGEFSDRTSVFEEAIRAGECADRLSTNLVQGEKLDKLKTALENLVDQFIKSEINILDEKTKAALCADYEIPYKDVEVFLENPTGKLFMGNWDIRRVSGSEKCKLSTVDAIKLAYRNNISPRSLYKFVPYPRKSL